MATVFSVDALLQLLADADGTGYIGEPVSQLAHALQCAARAAERDGSDAVVAASLLHDIGHLCAPRDAPTMAELGVLDHEAIGGAAARAAGLGDVVAHLIASHVAAKRYLVAQSASYRHKLSPASTATLAFQGGPMSAAEVARFEIDPLAQDILRLRAWDEEAKDPAALVPALESYRPLLERLAGT